MVGRDAVAEGVTPLTDALRAVADPARLAVVRAAAAAPGGWLCACALPSLLGLSPSTISHHLSALTRTGLLRREQRGRWAWFHLERPRVTELQALLDLPQTPPMSKPTVLFLCVHNAGRSQMAAAFLRSFAGDRIHVLSAGSAPADQVNPVAVEVMDEVGIDLRAEVPQRWTPDQALASDVVISMGCGDQCPVAPTARYEEWSLEDPAGQGLEMVRAVRDQIEQKVRGLMDSLLEDCEPA